MPQSAISHPPGPLSKTILDVLPKLQARDDLQSLWKAVHQSLDSLTKLIIEICQIPAPTFQETKRGDHVARYLKTHTGQEVQKDTIGNRWIRLKGRLGDGPCLLVSAHLDTVFPPSTNCTVRSENGRLIGPGIGDNCSGLGELLMSARLLCEADLPFAGELIVATNVGEEGLGNLMGMRALCDRFENELDGTLALDGSLGHVVGAAVGSLRYRISVKGPGGHSWSDFGNPSALHHIARVANALSNLEVPTTPRTSFNIGCIQGGTSINSIAEDAELLLDLRSVDPASLAGLDARAQRAIGSIKLQEGLALDVEQIGERPTGSSELMRDWIDIGRAAWENLGIPVQITASSTDANIPLSRGLKASTLGTCLGDRIHTTSEWIDPSGLPKSLEAFLLTTLAALELFTSKKESAKKKEKQ